MAIFTIANSPHCAPGREPHNAKIVELCEAHEIARATPTALRRGIAATIPSPSRTCAGILAFGAAHDRLRDHSGKRCDDAKNKTIQWLRIRTGRFTGIGQNHGKA
jgi:hypothetical protein